MVVVGGFIVNQNSHVHTGLQSLEGDSQLEIFQSSPNFTYASSTSSGVQVGSSSNTGASVSI